MGWFGDIVDAITDVYDTVSGGVGSIVDNPDIMKIIGTLGGAALGLSDANKPDMPVVGYQGGIPDYTAKRTPLTADGAQYLANNPDVLAAGSIPREHYDAYGKAEGRTWGGPSEQEQYLRDNPDVAASGIDPLEHYKVHGRAEGRTWGRRPGEGGRRYFSDMVYSGGDTDLTGAPMTPAGGTTVNTSGGGNSGGGVGPGGEVIPQQFAQGGIAQLPQGRYLGGATDGMADQIPANINGIQSAALSDGEFVIPADVVSHLGNGNSTAGAKELERMMSGIRSARTGTPKQGKRIDPQKALAPLMRTK